MLINTIKPFFLDSVVGMTKLRFDRENCGGEMGAQLRRGTGGLQMKNKLSIALALLLSAGIINLWGQGQSS